MQGSGSRGNSTNTKERATHKQKRRVALGGFFFYFLSQFFLSFVITRYQGEQRHFINSLSLSSIDPKGRQKIREIETLISTSRSLSIHCSDPGAFSSLSISKP